MTEDRRRWYRFVYGGPPEPVRLPGGDVHYQGAWYWFVYEPGAVADPFRYSIGGFYRVTETEFVALPKGWPEIPRSAHPSEEAAALAIIKAYTERKGAVVG